jgi:RecG-like helicase
MRTVKMLSVALALVFAVTLCVRAAEDKEVTLKGTITCAKCDLKTEKDCATVIQVKEGDKTVTYYFSEAKGKDHKAICQEAKKGTVTGKVSEKDKKMIITPSKVEFDK